MSNIYGNEATSVDLKVIKQLELLGWVPGDTLLYRPRYKLSEEQEKEYQKKYIEPDIVLQDPISKEILAVIENKYKAEKKAFAQLRIDTFVLKPRFLYACSESRILYYDNTWRGLEAGEYKVVDNFMSYETMKEKIQQQKNINMDREIIIDKSIAGGYDPTVGKERYYQIECINTIIEKVKEGKQRMLVHMATGLGKTRMSVALTKVMLENGLAKKILFIVDRRMLAKQSLDDGFSLISRDYSATRITTSNFRQNKHASIHVVVIDTLEAIFKEIPSNFYDFIFVDECHRSISINRKLIFNHFVCPILGLTATPKIPFKKKGTELSETDNEIINTYKLFGCEKSEADYKFDLERGIKEGFLAPYDVLEIKTHLTKEAEEEGIPVEYLLDPETRKKIELSSEMKIKLEQLEKKIISEERCKRIAEEIRKNTQYGEKVILFGVSQAHCNVLTKCINEVFSEDYSDDLRYAEAVISDNYSMNEFIKNKFKKPYQKPYIAVSVDIMSTGVDIPCTRYISFAALTKSVGKYIQMIGRGTRLDPEQSGKFSFRVLDFVGLCKRMEDNGYGTKKENKVKPKSNGVSGGGQRPPKGEYFLIDNIDPTEMIQRVLILGDSYEVIDNIPVEKAKIIFEEKASNPKDSDVMSIKQKVITNKDYCPSHDEIEILEEWINKPDIYLDEGQLQKIYDYPQGTIWEFLLDVWGIKRLPTRKERIDSAFDVFMESFNFDEMQIKVLYNIKNIIISNLSNHKDINASVIFGNPIYERIIGSKNKVDIIFDYKFDDILKNLKECLNI
ncbi:DEAD/DEAH box helicase family protein [Vallitalea okinawensis]|uniref:DEAD/DEAH box helicase family protein n=1 Tax=Vallitalea okinawensis TaxID=2078660 RepID=UPI000CFBAE00|nr:DEAD/DEAH box helicase family protein [Vallitalea okinawensis]